MGIAMKKVINFFLSFFLFLFFINTSLFAAEGAVFTEENLYALQEFNEAQKTSIRVAFECIREKTPEKFQDPDFENAVKAFITNTLSPNQIGETILALDLFGEKLKTAGFIGCLGKLYEKKIPTMNSQQIGAIFTNLTAIEDLSIFGHPEFSDKLAKLITAGTHPAEISQHIENLVILTRRALLNQSKEHES